ncbi:MAG: hypothetical protein CMM47_02440 [Rhodospirillaceae bacterium]|nr:hypothetical protein [Rhodospirillaceae bacterium]
MGTSARTNPDTRTGRLKYMAPDVESSLYRNGKVLTHRDRDGSDTGRKGIDLVEHDIPIGDARAFGKIDRHTLRANGFELIRTPPPLPKFDFLNQEQVVHHYYPACAEIVRDACGADFVIAFDHNVRSATGKQTKHRIKGGQQVQGPAHLVHGDYTLTSAPQRLRDLAKPPARNDTYQTTLAEGETLLNSRDVERALANGRYAIINLWRNIADEPVATHPLALCDAASVDPEDLVVLEIHYQDRIGENYFAKHADRHTWHFFPYLTRDEALLIKQWDSAGALALSNGEEPDSITPEAPCTFSFHSAFDDPTTPLNAPDRWSAEVRCLAIYV